MPVKYKIVKDNSFIITATNEYQSKSDEFVISIGSEFYYSIIDKDTLKEKRRTGFITNISDDGKITIDISTKYKSDVRTLDIKTFVSQYFDKNIDGYDYIFPGSMGVAGPNLVIHTDKSIIFEPQDNIIIREGDIVSNIRTRDTGRLIELKINKEKKSVSYKLDCSSDHFSNIILFEDDFNYDIVDGEMIAYNLDLKKESPLD